MMLGWLEQGGEWVLRLMLVMMGRMWVVLLVVWLWLGELDHVSLHLGDLLKELVNGMLKSLDEFVKIWEDQLEWVHIFVLVVLDCILELSVEGLLLDVLSLDRLVPLIVEAIHRGHDLAHVIEDSPDLSHDLKIRVA